MSEIAKPVRHGDYWKFTDEHGRESIGSYDAMHQHYYVERIASLEAALQAAQKDADDPVAVRNRNTLRVRAALDAARYRWLRQHSWMEHGSHGLLNFGPGCNQLSPELLDAAIDVAIATNESGDSERKP